MISNLKKLWFAGLAIWLAFSLQNCTQPSTDKAAAANENTATAPDEFYGPEDFNKVEKFDTHVHFNTADSTFLNQAKKEIFRLLTINVNPAYYPPIEKQRDIAIQLVQAYPERIAFATTISMEGFEEPGWEEKTLAYLKDSFAQGAIAVKVWKNIGMELKDRQGKFVMIDNPKFDPIFDFIRQNNKTLIGHIGEPRNAWLPIEQMTVAGDKNYFSKHPQYHMYLHPEYPSYEAILNSRDHVLQKHPNLRFVGAHLGSLEWSVDELAKRLDKFPNMAVDMAARIPHFQYQAVSDWQKVHDFFIKYQDRLIYATDLEVDNEQQPAQINKNASEVWRKDWQFFTSGEKMKVPKVEKEFNGLKLPREVVDKIYRKNAEKWFLGIAKNKV
ncbi:MAG: amidohydrolase [Adhaeribacter sp.]|nr:amidohydrolase [Adhaeribacter sp.]